MTDRALEIAKFMVEHDHEGSDLMAEMLQRFGDCTGETVRRGMAIGFELIEARIAENEFEIAKMRSA